MVAYAIAWQLGFWHWALPIGVLFVAAWGLPARWWPLLVLATAVQGTLLDLLYQHFTEQPAWPSLWHFMLGMVAPALLVLPGVALLRYQGDELGRPVDVPRIARLHIAALLVAGLYMLKDLVYVLADGQLIDIDQRHGTVASVHVLGTASDAAILTPFAISHFIGAFVGIMLLSPLAIWWSTRGAQPHNRDILVFTATWLLPTAAAYLLLAESFSLIQASEILRLLLLAAVVVASLKHGWRGAALAAVLVSVTVEVQDHLGSTHVQPILLQAFIAIVGAMGLLFGAARDELLRRDWEMTQLAERLRDTARRNQTQADDLRRWITSEVHDEVGQNLTALQMQVKLAENASGQPGLFAPMREIISHMRTSVSMLLGSLRPAGLDEFGLRRTLDEGSIRQLMGAAGVVYRVRLSGDDRLLERLSDQVQVSIYRIVQEAATNTLRHAGADRFDVALRIGTAGNSVRVFLRCADNGKGLHHAQRSRGGIGLDGIDDRVLSLGGKMRFRITRRGAHLLVVLECFWQP